MAIDATKELIPPEHKNDKGPVDGTSILGRPRGGGSCCPCPPGGASHPCQLFLVGDNATYTYADLVLEDGAKIRYTRTSQGTGKTDAVMEHASSPTKFHRSQLAWNATRGGWDLTLKDGVVYEFEGQAHSFGPHLVGIRDRHGNRLVVTRNPNGAFTWEAFRITTPNGRWVEFTLQGGGTGRVTQARDNAGRTVTYGYDAYGRLTSVTDPAGGVTEYTYDAQHRMLTLKDPRGIVYLTNEYDAAGRVIRQTQADGTTWEAAYTLDVDGKIIQTDVTNPRGYDRRVTFNAAGYPLTDTRAYGTAIAQTTTYERNGANQPTAITDGLGRRTELTYDGLGNVLTVTRLAGTANAVTTTATYEPTFNQVASVTDPLNHTTTFGYDTEGNLTTVTNALGQQTTLTYNPAGQPLTVTTPAGTTTYGYDRGDLATITDPTGQTARRFTDALGRLTALTAPPWASGRGTSTMG